MRVFVWSDGYGRGQSWLSIANASAQVLTAETLMGMEDGRQVIQSYTVGPLARAAWELTKIANGVHFWLRVRIDQTGAATLTIWDTNYKLPPYAPPPSVYDEAVTLAVLPEGGA